MLKIESKVGQKGEVRIPPVLRKKFKIQNGDKVIFLAKGDHLVIKFQEKSTVNKLEKIAEETEEVEIDSNKDYNERMRDHLA